MPAAEPLRVVLDTNIYFAAFRGPAGRNHRMWEAARFSARLLVSPAMVNELIGVLQRDGKVEPRAARRTARIVVRNAELVSTRSVLRVIADDPDDDRILECAVDGKADLIVSNDHHLLKLGEYAGIPIIAGPDFRRMLGVR